MEECSCIVDLKQCPHLTQCVIGERQVLPASYYVTFVWKQLERQLRCVGREKLAVEILNFNLTQPAILDGKEQFTCQWRLTQDGQFVISINNATCATGTIRKISQGLQPLYEKESAKSPRSETHFSVTTLGHNSASHEPIASELNSNDFYKVLQSAGIQYEEQLRCVRGVLFEDGCACIDWCTDWLRNIESHLQVILSNLPISRKPEYVTFCSKITIQPKLLKKTKRPNASGLVTEIFYDEESHSIHSAALSIEGVCTAPLQRSANNDIELRSRAFFPYFETGIRDHNDPLLSVYFELLRRHTHRIMALLIEKKFFANNPAFPDDLLRAVLEQSKSEKQLSDLESLLGAFDLNENHHAMLKCLRKVIEAIGSSSFVKECASLMANASEYLPNDRLFVNSLRDRILYPCVSLALENLPSTVPLKLCAFVYSESHIPTLEKIRSLMKSIRDIQLTCFVQDGTHKQTQTNGKPRTIHISHISESSNYLEEADLVICVNFISKQRVISESLSIIHKCIKDESFVLLIEPSCTLLIPLMMFHFDKHQSPVYDAQERTCGPYCDDRTWVRHLATVGLETVSQKSDSYVFSIYVCKKINNPHTHQSIVELLKDIVQVSTNDFSWIAKMEKQLKEKEECVWIKSSGNFHTGIDQLLPIYQAATPKKIKCIMTHTMSSKCSLPENDVPEMSAMFRKNLAFNIYNGHCWGSFYPFKLPNDITSQRVYHARLRKDGSNYVWYQDNAPLERDGKLLCHVHCFVMPRSGDDQKYQFDAEDTDVLSFSGRDNTGKRVFGLSFGSKFTSSVCTHPMYLWDIPPTWSMEQAATIPVDYTMTYYALYILSQLENHDDVIVIGAAAPCGVAASTVTMFAGHDVTAVVGSNRERDYVIESIGIGLVFKKSEEYLTKSGLQSKRQCLVVYAGPDPLVDLEDDVEVLSTCRARVLLLGNVDIEAAQFLADEYSLRLQIMTPEMLSSAEYKNTAIQVAAMLTRGIESGIVKPFSFDTYTAEHLTDLFQNEDRGHLFPYNKTLIQLREDDGGTISKPSTLPFKAVPQTRCHDDHMYIVCGDHPSSMLTSAYFLVTAGAKHVVFVMRGGVSDDMTPFMTKLLQSGVRIYASSADISKLKETVQLIKVCSRYGDIGGVVYVPFNQWTSIMKQEPQRLRNMKDCFDFYTKPLLAVTVHLDRVTRQLCQPSLHLFVIHSWHRNDIGQHHVTAFIDSFMEKICQQRRCDGLPGMFIRKVPQTKNPDGVHVMRKSLGLMDQLLSLPHHTIEYSCANEQLLVFRDEIDTTEKLVDHSITPIGADMTPKVESEPKKTVPPSISEIKEVPKPPKRTKSKEKLLDVTNRSERPRVSSEDVSHRNEQRNIPPWRRIEKGKSTVRNGAKEEVPDALFIAEDNSDSVLDNRKEVEQNNSQTHHEPKPVAPKRRRPRSWHFDKEPAEDTITPESPVFEKDQRPLNTISEGIMLRSPTDKNAVGLHEQPRAPPRRRRSLSVTSLPVKKPAPEAVHFLSRLFAPQHLMVKMNSPLNHQLTPIFVIHAAEGTVRCLNECMMSVNSPVYGLQCSEGAPFDNVNRLSAFYIKKIQTLYPKGPYILCGYGLTTCVAFQMAAELQRQGHVVQHVIFLNGSPSSKPSMSVPDATIHRNLLYSFLALREYIPLTLDQLNIALGRSAIQWSSMVHRSVDYLISQSEDEAIKESNITRYKTFINQYCHLLKAVEEYSVLERLADTELTVIKPQEDTTSGDYDLSQVCTGPVSIQTVPGSSSDFLTGSKGQQVANIINRIVGSESSDQNGSCDVPKRPERHRRKRILSDPTSSGLSTLRG